MNRISSKVSTFTSNMQRMIAMLLIVFGFNTPSALAEGTESLDASAANIEDINITFRNHATDQKLTETAVVYKLSMLGMSAEVDIRLTKTGPDQYQYQSTTQAKGLASLIRPNAAIETSRFHMIGTRIFVDEYLFDSGSGDKFEDSYARFAWQQQIAFSNHQEETREVPISPGVLDRMSADLMVTLDLQAGRSPGNYAMVHRNYVKTYRFTEMGKEEIKTKAGTFNAIKYLRQREGSSRSAYIWYAPDLGYQPIKVVQLKKGKVRGTLLFESYRPVRQ